MTSWPGAVALVVALLMRIAFHVPAVPAAPSHNAALTGFRGYLAFGVFLHHSVVWYYHLHNGGWAQPPLAVYRELGLDCVNFFFMITAFLFVGKLVESRGRPVDWLRLYVGRLLRIVPLYLLVISVLLLMVGHATDWRLREPVPALFLHSGQWLAFGMAHTGEVNAFPATGMLMAFVNWTLAYEWMFYFSLPLIALAMRQLVPVGVLLLTLVALATIAWGIPNLFFPTSFVAGGLVAFLARNERSSALLRSRWVGVAALAGIAILLSGVVPHRAALAVQALVFCAIGCGNTLLGLLSNRAAVELGEMSYGIYLMHSLVLSATLLFMFGPDAARALSPSAFWSLIVAIGAGVVVLSACSYRFVELPALRLTGALSTRLRRSRGGIAEWHLLKQGKQVAE